MTDKRILIPRSFKLYIVEWNDAYTTGEHWQPIGEEEMGVTCTSIGCLTRETKDYIQLTPHLINSENGNVCGSIMIPRSAIIRKQEIKIK